MAHPRARGTDRATPSMHHVWATVPRVDVVGDAPTSVTGKDRSDRRDHPAATRTSTPGQTDERQAHRGAARRRAIQTLAFRWSATTSVAAARSCPLDPELPTPTGRRQRSAGRWLGSPRVARERARHLAADRARAEGVAGAQQMSSPVEQVTSYKGEVTHYSLAGHLLAIRRTLR